MSQTNRNKVRQVIINKDGSKKVIFHNKPTHATKFQGFKPVWDMLNKTPKPNSKRQKEKREKNNLLDAA